MHLILSIAGFVAFLFTVAFLMTIRNLAGFRMRRPTTELRSGDMLPAYLEELFKPAESRLRALGFDHLSCLYNDGFIVHQMSGKWAALFGNREESAYAEVTLTTVQAEMPGFELTFSTIFTDDTMLQTVNCRSYAMLVEIPKVVVNDPCVASIEDQWLAHREKSRQLQREKTPLPLSPLHYVARQQVAGSQMIDAALACGRITATDDNEYAFRLSRIVPFAWRLLKGQLLLARMQKARKKLEDFSSETMPLEVEVESFLRIESLNRKKPIGRMGKTVILLISVILFSLSFGVGVSLQNLLFLVGAVMFHELGHFLGMYLCGYGNLQILFVPFLGALAYGAEQNARPHHRVIVLLLGPVPGIVLGVTGLALYGNLQWEWLQSLSILMLTLNMINLIPVAPLDGGQLVQTLLANRFPRILALFYVASTLVLGAAALLMNDAALQTLSIALCLNIPLRWRQGSALVRMKKGLAECCADERRRLAHFFAVLREKPFTGLPFPKKVLIVKAAERELTAAPTSLRLIAIAVLTCTVTVSLPVITVVSGVPFAARKSFDSVENRNSAPDWKVRIAQAKTNDERFSLLLQAGYWSKEHKNTVAAKDFFTQADVLAKTFGENDSRLAESCIASASLEDADRAAPLLKQALAIQDQQSNADNEDVATTMHLLINALPTQSAIQLLEQRLAKLEQSNEHTNYDVLTLLMNLIRLHDRSHDDRAAEQTVERCLTLMRQSPHDAQTYFFFRDLAFYYAAHEQFAEAEKLLNEGMTRIPADQTFMQRTFKTELGWLYLTQGNGDKAVTMLRHALIEQRAARKADFSYKKLGLATYLLMKISAIVRRTDLSDPAGLSLQDRLLLMDLSAISLASGKNEEAKSYFEELRQLEARIGSPPGSRLTNRKPSVDQSDPADKDFQMVWEHRKELMREACRTKFL